jgi:hypothetical protein
MHARETMIYLCFEVPCELVISIPRDVNVLDVQQQNVRLDEKGIEHHPKH